MDSEASGRRLVPWWYADEATMQECSLADVGVMAEVSAYNQVDCADTRNLLRGHAPRGLAEASQLEE